MWFLEHETLFGGKRVWLRPGSQQLFGRTKPDGNQTEGIKVFIDNKNVSRKHMMIKMLEVPPEDGTKLHARSQVEITDLSCRQGTVIDNGHTLKSTKKADGDIVYDKTILAGTEHTIRLSQSYPAFTLRWKDVVFTYASKETERMKARSAQLHAIGIKTSSEFVYGKTTHVVSQKRNLPKVLQALVSATPIVTSDFIDAILNAAAYTVDELDNYVPSKLEENFDLAWPQEKEYISPAGQEPVPRPDQMLEPDPSRSEVFSGLTFVFLDETQHANLQQFIAGGGGKALLYKIHLGETTVDEYVDYVKSVAGQKRRAKTSNGALPVVTIRLSVFSDDLQDWATRFVTGVDQALNQRSILQNEFLDAIITKDISSLQRPPSETMEVDFSMPPSTQTERSMREMSVALQPRATPQAPEASSAPAEDPPKPNPRKRPIRRGATSRFTGFDDYEPPTKARKIEETPMEDIQESMPVQEPSQSISGTQTRHTTQKRNATQSKYQASAENRAEQMDQLFPAAAAIKRQRAATAAPSASVDPEVQPSAQKPKTKATQLIEQMQRTKKKADKEIDVRKEARKRIEEDEERRRIEEESLREALEGVDIAEIRANVEIEEMPLRPQSEMPNSRSQVQIDRWNPDWNGRKNFKKFRRRGAERGPQSQKVLVTFEEAPQKKGFGDSAFFLEAVEPTPRTKEDERRLKRRMGRPAGSESDAETGFSRKKRTKQTPVEVVNVEDSGGDDNGPVVSGRTQKSSGKTQRVAETQLGDAQTQTQRRSGSSSKKRGPPVSVAAGQPAAKKGRMTRRDDSSDEEETGFRFKRRG
ncbi:hypothetical protein K458DRAFT_324211 [Lentithecium fluviatile CBS 122367]|uniref:FHA domain-containing protein n=1 Tax=Lentithecium fluviatile CBS 122367 TaxID=1168545 RepID=A0A6G1IBZ7_9PLEO|nr:hypothetical protein K458DRAFT_324211 [Lentithecium fluviatile CBS 122367]